MLCKSTPHCVFGFYLLMCTSYLFKLDGKVLKAEPKCGSLYSLWYVAVLLGINYHLLCTQPLLSTVFSTFHILTHLIFYKYLVRYMVLTSLLVLHLRKLSLRKTEGLLKITELETTELDLFQSQVLVLSYSILCFLYIQESVRD